MGLFGKTEPSSGGVLFWFNWQTISDSGHSFYGAYVYKQLLPHFAPEREEFPLGHYVFFDGDFLPQGPVQIPCHGAGEARCLEEVKRQGADRCYLVAVHGMGPVDFAEVDRGLRDADAVGYLGITSCPGIDFEGFYQLTGSMSLPLAFQIRGRAFRKESFGFVGDDALRSMGFEPSDSEG